MIADTEIQAQTALSKIQTEFEEFKKSQASIQEKLQLEVGTLSSEKLSMDEKLKASQEQLVELQKTKEVEQETLQKQFNDLQQTYFKLKGSLPQLKRDYMREGANAARQELNLDPIDYATANVSDSDDEKTDEETVDEGENAEDEEGTDDEEPADNAEKPKILLEPESPPKTNVSASAPPEPTKEVVSEDGGEETRSDKDKEQANNQLQDDGNQANEKQKNNTKRILQLLSKGTRQS